MSRHDTILSAYPGLLPGFFNLTDDNCWVRADHRLRFPPVDASASDTPRYGSAAHRSWRRMQERYHRACAAAVSVMLNYGDAIVAGDSVIVTCALSADQFDRLAALGAEFEDFENDDPGEDDDPAEEDGCMEEDHRDEFGGGQ